MDLNDAVLSVMGPGSPILAVDLGDSSVSTVVATGLSGTDSITMDREGRVYVSEWTGDTVRRYDCNFSNPPRVLLDQTQRSSRHLL